jgi:hypothetical protein
LGFGATEDAAGLVVFLASDAAAAVSGQAIGIGGDSLSLWSHPAEVETRFADGDWTADGIASAWPEAFLPHQQPVGQQIPVLPK